MALLWIPKSLGQDILKQLKTLAANRQVPPDHMTYPQRSQGTPPLPHRAVWLQVLLQVFLGLVQAFFGLLAGIVFALANKFVEYPLFGAQSLAVALLILGVGLLIVLAMAGSVWRKYRAFAVTFLVAVVLAAVQDVQWWQSM